LQNIWKVQKLVVPLLRQTLKHTAMANLQHAFELTKSLLDEQGLTAKGWKVTINKRTSSLGLCRHKTKEIQLSAFHFPHCTEDSAWDTITHEVAHAIVGFKRNPYSRKREIHGEEWKRVHMSLGGSGRVRATKDDYIDGKAPARAPRSERATYKGTCPNGHVHYRFRLPKGQSSCAISCEHFDKRFLITYTLNNVKSLYLDV